MSTNTDTAIIVEDLHKTYGQTRALNGLSFSVPTGSIFGLLGPNGAGKSTCIRVLTTLTSPDSGRVTICGRDLQSDANTIQRTIGLVNQKTGADPDATGRENLWLHGRLRCIGRAALRQRSRELIEQLNLTEPADRPVRTWSGGMIRRLDLAIALVHRPKVLILDEPTTGLDPEVRQTMWEDLRHLVDTDDLTILLTTHYMDEADQLADQVAIMYDGTIAVGGTPSQLKALLPGPQTTLNDVFLSITSQNLPARTGELS